MEVLRPGASLALLPLPLRRLAFNLAAPARLSRGPEPDLVVGFDLDGFLVPRDAHWPFVLSLKGVAADEARFEEGPAALGRRAAGWLEGRSARDACRVLVPSRYSARRARAAYGLDPDRISVVPEGIRLEAWEEPAGMSRREDPTILSVARQYPRKNTATLIRAMPRVLESAPGARLRVVGGGPELPRLRRLAGELGLESAVVFLGALDDGSLSEEYGRAWIFCLPSRQEGFGIVFLEAMAAGLPVVGGRAGAVPEVVHHGETGLLVDPDDPRALAAALIRLLAAPEEAAALARAGRRRARRFDLRRVGLSFLRAVEPCLRTRGPGASPAPGRTAT